MWIRPGEEQPDENDLKPYYVTGKTEDGPIVVSFDPEDADKITLPENTVSHIKATFTGIIGNKITALISNILKSNN